VATVNDVLTGPTVLDIACLDRLYLTGFVPGLPTPGGVIYFLPGRHFFPRTSLGRLPTA
jgi:hypothetical protein